MACQLSRPVLAMRGESRAASPLGTLCRALLIGALLVLPACAGAQRKSTTEMDALLQQGKSVEVAGALRAANGNQAYLEWLAAKSREGFPLAQYELASRGLDLKDGEEVAAQWYARARLALILDSAECRRSDSSMLFGLYLDSTYKRLDEFARTHQDIFASASQSALEAEAKTLSRPSAAWICDPEAKRTDGGLLPPAEASNARAAERKRMEGRTALLVQQQTLAKAPVNPDGFKVIQPPAQISNSRIAFWMDDARLVVRTRVEKDEQVWLWNVETGEIERLTRLEGARQVCYFEGFVRYERTEGKLLKIFEGPWGEESEVWQAPLDPTGTTYRPLFNQINCRMYDEDKLPEGVTVPLLEKHGGLGDSEKYDRYMRSNKPMTFFDPSGEPKKKVSFTPNNVRWPIHYLPYLDAYLVNVWQSAGKDPYRIILLAGDGTETEQSFPMGPWMTLSADVVPSKVGLVLKSNASPGAAGVYLKDEHGGIRRILESAGQSDANVSPSGCYLAVTRGAVDVWKEELFVFRICGGVER